MKRKLPKIKNRLGILFLFLFDICTIFAIFKISVLIRGNILPEFLNNLPGFHHDFRIYSWIFPVWLAIMIYEQGYSKRFAAWDEIKFVWKSTFFALVSIFAILFISKKGPVFSRILIITMGLVSFVLFPIIRLQFKKLLYKLTLMRRKILVVGSGEAAVNAYNSITNEPNLGYQIVSFIDDNPQVQEIKGIKVRPNISRIERYIKTAGVHDVIVAKPELSKEELVKLVNHIQHKAENTLYIPDITGIAVSGTELRHFFREQAMIIQIKNNLANPLIYGVKRVLDYIAGLLILIILLIPMLIVMLIINLTSKGPAIYKQERFGKNRKIFYCYKFRTMYKDADKKLKEVLESDPQAKQEWEESFKLKNDPRITPIGNFLRKTSLDELPQLFNILKGEMSLVGPRPVVKKEIEEYYKENAVFYFQVPPGLTGLWQISGRSNTSYEYRITLDSWYVKNWNLWLDIMILFKTIGVVLKREGAV